MKPIQILAHRGLVSEFVPENSLKAFADALASGADVIETDVQCTKDSVAIIFHDDDLNRICGLDKKISDSNWSELSKLNIGFGKRIPSLREALLAFPDARFNLDIKSSTAIAPVAAVVNELNAHNQVLISSFSDKRRQKTVDLMKFSVKTSAGVYRVLSLLASARFGLRAWSINLSKNLDALQIPTHRGLLRLDSPSFIRKMKSLNLEVHFWTINEPSEMRRLIALGADGIVTDRCDIAAEVLKK